MKKRIIAAFVIMCMIFTLTGCMEASWSIKISKDGTVTSDMMAYYNREGYYSWFEDIVGSESMSLEEFDSLMTESGFQIQNVDGVDYYVDTTQTEHDASTIVGAAKGDRATSVNGEYQMWETGIRINLDQLAEERDMELDDEDYSKKEMKQLKKLMKSSYIVISAEFDYDITVTDSLAIRDESNPKKVKWRISFADLKGNIYALCNSQILVSGVTQGASYKNPVTLNYQGAATAVSGGRSVVSGESFGDHGQHTVILTSAEGEQRTVTFFIDKKKPVIKKIKDKKLYKKGKTFSVADKDSGITKVTINGKKAKETGKENTFVLNKKGKNRIVVKDGVGNVSRMTVRVK